MRLVRDSSGLTRLVAAVRAVTAAAALVGLVVGVPVALWRLVGAPWPTVVPGFDDVRFAITRGQVDSWTIIKGVALVAWAAYLHLMVSLGVEAAAAVRGGTARAVRGLGATQWIAAGIVARVTVVAGLVVQSGASMVGAVPVPDLPSPTAVAARAATVVASPAGASTVPVAESVGSGRVVVGRTDTLWGLAETHLGDGERWPEIRDANVGAVMGDGTVLPAGFTAIESGWTLRIPGAVTAPPESGHDSATGEWIVGSWRVEEGDHFWKISSEVLAEAWGRSASQAEVRAYWVDMVDANREHLVSPGDDPDLIYPRQEFEVLLPPVPSDVGSATDSLATTVPFTLAGLDQFTPAVPAAPGGAETVPDRVDAPEAVDPPVSPPPVQTPDVRVVVERPAAESREADATAAVSEGPFEVSRVALGLFGLGVGAAGLMFALRRRRSYRAARRRPNTTVPDTPVVPSQFEERIRPIADHDALRWLYATNRFLTHRLGAHPESALPAVIAMRAGSYGVELLLDDPAAPVDGFVSEGPDGAMWRLHPDLEPRMIEAEGGDAQPYCPAMVPVGSTLEGDLLLDFEQLGALSVAGDDATVVGWLRSLAVGVTSVPWAQSCEVVAIGLGDEIGGISQVSVPDDPAEWAKGAVRAHSATAGRLTASTYENRVKPGEVFWPQIVLVGPGFEGVAQYLAEAADLAYSPLALVAAAPLGGADRVEIGPGLATLEPLGLEFEPVVTELDAISIAVEALASVDDVIAVPEPDYFAGASAGATVYGSVIDVTEPGTGFDMDGPWPDLHAQPEDASGGDGDDRDGDDVPLPERAPVPAESEDGGGDIDGDTVIDLDRLDRPGPDDPAPVGAATAAAIAEVVAACPVEVTVLGPSPGLVGLEREVRPKIAALIIYVTFMGSVSSDRIRQVFWPRSTNRGTADNAIAEARRVLGVNAAGETRLPSATATNRFEVDAEVACDWHRVQRLVELGAQAVGPVDEMACLEAALGFVGGVPGADAPMGLYRWLVDDYEVYGRIETVLVDAANRLGELALDAGDHGLARWAADQGLRVVPGQEALHRIEMRACALVGDSAGVEAAYRRATRSAEAFSAWEEVQPETDALFETLTRGGEARTGSGQR